MRYGPKQMSLRLLLVSKKISCGQKNAGKKWGKIAFYTFSPNGEVIKRLFRQLLIM